MLPKTVGQGRYTHDERTYAIIGAAQKVHGVLGCGFLERVYQEALAVELRSRNIPFEREVELRIHYEGVLLNCPYKLDFLCQGEVVVELKALSRLGGIEEAQVLNYLKASGLEVGLLLNFGTKSLEVQRFALSWHQEANTKSASSA